MEELGIAVFGTEGQQQQKGQQQKHNGSHRKHWLGEANLFALHLLCFLLSLLKKWKIYLLLEEKNLRSSDQKSDGESCMGSAYCDHQNELSSQGVLFVGEQ